MKKQTKKGFTYFYEQNFKVEKTNFQKKSDAKNEQQIKNCQKSK